MLKLLLLIYLLNVIIAGVITQQDWANTSHLSFDLLGAQIKACKEIGIKVLFISL